MMRKSFPAKIDHFLCVFRKKKKNWFFYRNTEDEDRRGHAKEEHGGVFGELSWCELRRVGNDEVVGV